MDKKNNHEKCLTNRELYKQLENTLTNMKERRMAFNGHLRTMRSQLLATIFLAFQVNNKSTMTERSLLKKMRNHGRRY